jgi:hypothetical protein
MKFRPILHTNGTGYWSNKAKAVQVTKIEVTNYDNDDFGELRVFFTKKTWNPEKDGLIYTDALFEKELLAALKKEGFKVSGVGYSEQGMQGPDYVSLDCGSVFLKSVKKIAPEIIEEVNTQE